MIGAACDRCNQLGVCVVGAVNDGKCSLRWSARVHVVEGHPDS